MMIFSPSSLLLLLHLKTKITLTFNNCTRRRLISHLVSSPKSPFSCSIQSSNLFCYKSQSTTMVSQLSVKGYIHEDSSTICYLIHDPQTRKAAIIDSVLDFEVGTCKTGTRFIDSILKEMQEQSLELQYVLETHCHADHLTACHYVKDKFPSAISAMGKRIRETQSTFKKIYNLEGIKTDGSQFDLLLEDGHSFYLGSIAARVLETPGHTVDSVTYYVGDCVFVGDTLFKEDSGTARCDFPNGSSEQLYKSIEKIFKLPDDTRVFLCHDYGCGESRPIQYETNIGSQKSSNIHVKSGTSLEEYRRVRDTRDAKLPFPKLLIPSIQFNVQGGVPVTDDQGAPYLKYPMNQTDKFTRIIDKTVI